MYAFCRETIPMFGLKERIALGVMEEMRCPLQFASNLYDEMQDKIDEYCEDNGLDYDKMWEASSGDLVEDVFWEGCSADSSNTD